MRHKSLLVEESQFAAFKVSSVGRVLRSGPWLGIFRIWDRFFGPYLIDRIDSLRPY
jgi:hypothetical protein